MSNSFVSPPTIADPQTVVAGQPISAGAVTALGQTINYSFARGGISNVISQAWTDGACSQSLTTYQTMCEWQLPAASTLHQDLEVYLLVRGTGSIRLTLLLGGVSTVEEVATSGGSEALYSQTLSLGTFSATFGTLTLEAKATSGTLRISSIMARWAPLSSPLPTEQGSIVGQVFTPMGVSRLGVEKPLSARVGHRMIDNITTLRGRLRTWVSWSAVNNADNAGTSLAPAEWIGTGDLLRMLSPTHVHGAETLPQTIYCAVRAANIVTDLTVDLLGMRYTLTINGWNFLTLTLDLDSERGSSFKLPVYRVGLDPSQHNIFDTDWSDVGDPSSGLAVPVVTALCMWGP